ncbi:hypothetical protein BKA81DRAFT_190401 [Phyllosticta paracitricarpa]
MSHHENCSKNSPEMSKSLSFDSQSVSRNVLPCVPACRTSPCNPSNLPSFMHPSTYSRHPSVSLFSLSVRPFCPSPFVSFLYVCTPRLPACLPDCRAHEAVLFDCTLTIPRPHMPACLPACLSSNAIKQPVSQSFTTTPFCERPCCTL